jgi:hypothetical protein
LLALRDDCPVEVKVVAADDPTALGRYSGMRGSFSQRLMGCQCFRGSDLVRLAQLSRLFNIWHFTIQLWEIHRLWPRYIVSLEVFGRHF